MLPQKDAPHATLINNWIDKNTGIRWKNFTIRMNFILQKPHNIQIMGYRYSVFRVHKIKIEQKLNERGGGVKTPQRIHDVIYGWPL